MVNVEFLKDFAGRKKKEVIKMDGMIASSLKARGIVKIRQRASKKDE